MVLVSNYEFQMMNKYKDNINDIIKTLKIKLNIAI